MSGKTRKRPATGNPSSMWSRQIIFLFMAVVPASFWTPAPMEDRELFMHRDSTLLVFLTFQSNRKDYFPTNSLIQVLNSLSTLIKYPKWDIWSKLGNINFWLACTTNGKITHLLYICFCTLLLLPYSIFCFYCWPLLFFDYWPMLFFFYYF